MKKKIVTTSICVVTVAATFIWYFFPVLAGKWFIYNNSTLHRELNVRPANIDKLPASTPDKWEKISIDTLYFSLPMYRFNKIKVTSISTGIGFISDQGNVFLPTLVPSIELLKTLKEKEMKYPIMSYKEFLAEFSTIPDDISFFNSRSENKTIYNNLTLKLIAIPASGLNDVIAVNSSNLKVICIMHETQKNGFGATLILYNQTENMTFDMTLAGYKNPDMLHSDILNILGSIKMPEQPLNSERVKTDIESITRIYNLTTQTI